MSLYEVLKKYRKHTLFLCDLLLLNISFYLSFAINRDNFSFLELKNQFISCIFIINICFPTVFILFRLYDKIWRYADIEDFLYVGIANFCANFLFFVVTILFKKDLGIRMYVLFLLMSAATLFVFRLLYKINRLIDNKTAEQNPSDNLNRKKLLIIGGGESTLYVLKEISKHADSEYLPICIVDDDREKIGRKIMGIKVEGSTYEIPDICKKLNIELILFSISSITTADKIRILDICSKTGLEVRVMPNLYEIVTSGTPITPTIRKVEVKDLLGREQVVFDDKIYGNYIKGSTVLVTGGGGSIGSELCRQIANLEPNLLIILDIYENNAYEIQQELLSKHKKDLNFKVQIASVRDEKKIDKIFKENNIEVVFHAAAHKHVPLMEHNPEEAIKNNIFGTLNVARCADKYKIKKFVLISTDKAVNPTSVMGATKRVCEIIVQIMNKSSDTEFVAVRFGNVLGSNGSVIPLFEKQIRHKGPITVTHPNIIRYFMTIPEAVSLVLTSGSLAQGGEIFVLDMGDPVKIKDLAENLIRLSGFIPGKDIKIEYTGLRPGEKLYEELLLSEEGIKKTKNKKIYIAKPIDVDAEKFKMYLEKLHDVSYNNNSLEIENILSGMVTNFKHKK